AHNSIRREVGPTANRVRNYDGTSASKRLVGDESPSLSSGRWQNKDVAGCVAGRHFRLISKAQENEFHTNLRGAMANRLLKRSRPSNHDRDRTPSINETGGGVN